MYCCVYSHMAAVVFLAFSCPSLNCGGGDDSHMYADLHINTVTHVYAHLPYIILSDMNQKMPIRI